MVLQQQCTVKLWGTAAPNQTVQIVASWNNKKEFTKSDPEGKWLFEMQTPAAGGPYQISFSDKDDTKTVTNIMTGEVWLCSGQSNMSMPMRGFAGQPILNANEIIAKSMNNNLRLLTVGRGPELTPKDDFKGEWKVSDPETSREFSAVAYQFGDLLQKQLKVPVGIIVAAYGGTQIECWMSREALAKFPQVKIPSRLDSVKQAYKEPTVHFNSMIYPLLNFRIKGLIWYQGESNRNEATIYPDLLTAMVADWRKGWGLGNIPFYYTEIAPYASKKPEDGVTMRNAQQKGMELIPHSGMACIIDAGMENCIHFMDKTKVATRLAYWAFGDTYQIKGIGYRSPAYKSYVVKGSKMILRFETSANGLTSYGKPITLFELAGEDGAFHKADARIINNATAIEVHSSAVSKPVAVRYAWKNWVVGEIYNTDGLPLPSFHSN